MTDKPHTPSTPYIEDGWLCEPCEPDYAPGISPPIPGSWSEPIVNLAELDGYDELIAAAEQRGAIKALRDAAKDWRWSEWSNSPRNPIAAANYVGDWLTDRADRVEGTASDEND